MALQIILTVDTEFWPGVPIWPNARLARPWVECDREYERGVLGRTVEGDFGLPYLLQALAHHGLHAVFFVESLFASAVGASLLQRTVRAILAASQEVQLHVHAEWLAEIAAEGLPTGYRRNLADFSVEEQTAVVGHALANLRRAGAPHVIAMRAGNMSGNQDTPVAAKRTGLKFDFSSDPSRGRDARAALAESRYRTAAGMACVSVPLSCVKTFPGRLRHAQLGALSSAEMESALITAARAKWDCFVILMHSFELVHKPARNGQVHVNRTNIKRFNRLCRFLARQRDRFETVGCDTLRHELSPPIFPRTRPVQTLMRIGEQLYSRLG